MLNLGNGLGSLKLFCFKCTRESSIPAPTMEVAVDLAKLRGWVIENGKYVCPTCPAVRSVAA